MFALIAVLAALVLAVPIVIFFVLRGDNAQQGAATGTTPAATTTTAVATPTVSAGETAVPAPNGRIPLAQLKNATLNLPAWPTDNLTCPSGRVTFANGKVRMPDDSPFIGRIISLDEAWYGDVDRDGATETVAWIRCVMEGASVQLLALDRDTAGRIVTLGTVVATTGPVRGFGSPTISAGGVVSVTVADYQGCCGDETPIQTQRRSYGWNGQRFVQVGGPTAFPPNPHVTETGVTTTDLVFDDGGAGSKFAALKVTVTYLYGTKPDHLRLGFYSLPADVHPIGPWPSVTPTTNGFVVDVPTPAIGKPATYTFTFARPSSNSGGDLTVMLTGMSKQNVELGDSNPYNGAVQLVLK